MGNPTAPDGQTPGQRDAALESLTRDIGGQLAKIGQGLQESMVALTKAEDARTRRAQAGKDISRLTEEPNNGIDPSQPVNFEFE